MSIGVKITTYLWENDDKRLLELKINLFLFFSKLIYGLLMTRKKIMSVILLIRNKHFQQLPLPQYRERRMD